MYILYSILLCLGLCRSIACPNIYIFLIPLFFFDVCVLGSRCEIVNYYLVDIAALSELEAQAFLYTRINIC